MARTCHRCGRVGEASLRSIYSQEAQQRVIKTHHCLKAALPGLLARYLAGADVLALAFGADFPPCIVVRRLLEALPLGLGRQVRAWGARRGSCVVEEIKKSAHEAVEGTSAAAPPAGTGNAQ